MGAADQSSTGDGLAERLIAGADSFKGGITVLIYKSPELYLLPFILRAYFITCEVHRPSPPPCISDLGQQWHLSSVRLPQTTGGPAELPIGSSDPYCPRLSPVAAVTRSPHQTASSDGKQLGPAVTLQSSQARTSTLADPAAVLF